MAKKKDELIVEVDNDTPLPDDVAVDLVADVVADEVGKAERALLERDSDGEPVGLLDPEEFEEEPEGNEHYTVGTWKGMPNYQCRLCPYASLDFQKLTEHVFNEHIRPKRLEEAKTKLLQADARGRIVKE